MTRYRERLLLIVFLTVLTFGMLPGATVQAEEIVLTWMMYGAPEQAPIFEALIADFEAKNPGYKVQLLPMVSTSDYRQRLLTYFAAGEEPDVFLTFAQYRDSFIESGLLYDLTDLFNQSTMVSRDMYYPAIRDVFEVDGRIWGTPWGYNAKVWVVNKDILEQRGLASPSRDWTVDDLREYARLLTDPQAGIIGTDAAFAISDTPGNLGWTYNYTGGYWIDLETKAVRLEHPGFIQMLEYWLELQDVYRAAGGFLIPRPASGLRGGQVAMYETWSTEPNSLTVLAGAGDWEWELASVPAGPVSNSHFAQGHLWSIPSTHPNPEAAWKFVEYLGSYDAELMWAQTGRTPPQVHDIELWEIYFSNVPTEKRRDAIAFILNDLYAAGRAKTFTYWDGFAEMESLMKGAISRVMNRQESPGTAVANLARTFQALLNQ